jgi:hypothetical protein
MGKIGGVQENLVSPNLRLREHAIGPRRLPCPIDIFVVLPLRESKRIFTQRLYFDRTSRAAAPFGTNACPSLDTSRKLKLESGRFVVHGLSQSSHSVFASATASIGADHAGHLGSRSNTSRIGSDFRRKLVRHGACHRITSPASAAPTLPGRFNILLGFPNCNGTPE